MPKGRSFPGEFKQEVVEDIIHNKLGYREAMRKYGICGKMTVQKWERIYLEEGAEGLYVERRGQASGSRKGRPPKLEKHVEDDLIAEVQRLRAENAYLKNLQALVMERERQQQKKRW